MGSTFEKEFIACPFWFFLLHNSSNRLQQNDFIAGMDVVKINVLYCFSEPSLSNEASMSVSGCPGKHRVVFKH